MTKSLDQLQQLTQDLFQHLDIHPQKIDITLEEDNLLQLNLDLDEADTGILIGYHGDTISSLQLLLGLFLYNQTGTWNRLVVNIGDYRQKRTQSLEKMAQTTAQRVKFSGEPITLFNLNPFERRIIHSHLADYPEVSTQSEGEGKDRCLTVFPKDSSAPPLPSDQNQPDVSDDQPLE